MNINISISSCPNDTFMFDALINRRIDNRGYNFNLKIEDIEQLNKHILTDNDIHISKISCALYPLIEKQFALCTSGSALGRGNGPLIISKRKIYPDEMQDVCIAIPGIHTTANALLDFAFPGVTNKREYLFSDIADVVLSNECDAGILIHEQRFVYQKMGLKLLCDLGEVWETKTTLPIPLGAIAIARSLELKIQVELSQLIKQSILYAFNNPSHSKNFVIQHAKEINEEVIEKHIKMFVNEYSIDISAEGKKAVEKLLKNKCNPDNIFI